MELKELDVIIQNVLKYEDKDNKGVFKTRLGYIVNSPDAYQDTEKFKGIPELSLFTNNTKLFDSLAIKHTGKSATLKFKEKVNPRNPLKSIMDLQEIKFKDETISLL